MEYVPGGTWPLSTRSVTLMVIGVPGPVTSTRYPVAGRPLAAACHDSATKFP